MLAAACQNSSISSWSGECFGSWVVNRLLCLAFQVSIAHWVCLTVTPSHVLPLHMLICRQQ